MIVLPLFWDQVDNAQRVEETGFGRRLSTYGFRDEELTDAIDELLADEALAARLAAMSSAHQVLVRNEARRRTDRASGPHRRVGHRLTTAAALANTIAGDRSERVRFRRQTVSSARDAPPFDRRVR